MTYTEYITAMVTRFGGTAQDVQLILANQAERIPTPNAQADIRTAQTALCLEFASLIPLANVSEGGYSVSWNMEALKIWYSATCAKLGIADVTKPKIRNRSHLW